MEGLKLRNLKRPASIFLCAGIIFGVAALIVYLLTGVNEFNPELSPAVIGFLIAAMVLGACMLVLRLLGIDQVTYLKPHFNLFGYGAYLLALFAFMYYAASQVNYVVNVIVAIDGTTISAAFVLTMAFLLLTFAAFLVSAIMLGRENLAPKGEIVYENERV